MSIRKKVYLQPLETNRFALLKFPAAYCFMICGRIAVVKLMAKLFTALFTCIEILRAAFTIGLKKMFSKILRT